jgi:hypothetical protein
MGNDFVTDNICTRGSVSRAISMFSVREADPDITCVENRTESLPVQMGLLS